MESIELNDELNGIKSDIGDLAVKYAAVIQRIAKFEEKLNQIEMSKEEVVQNQSVVQIPTPDTNEEVVKTQEQVTPIEQSTDASVQEASVEKAVITPLIQKGVDQALKEEEKTVEAVPGPQELNQTPITPTVQEVQRDKEVYIKEDNYQPKAILISPIQSEKLRGSKIKNKDDVLGEKAVITPIEQSKTPEQEMNAMMEQAQQLYAAGKTAEAEQMTAKILSKNVGIAS